MNEGQSISDYVIIPNDATLIGKSNSESIQNAVNYAASIGANSVTIPRIDQRTNAPIWILDHAVILPSNREIVLDNCRPPFNVRREVVLKYSEIYGENVTQPSGEVARTELPVLEHPLT